jgi:Flp pilus assembly secretin CpaC
MNIRGPLRTLGFLGALALAAPAATAQSRAIEVKVGETVDFALPRQPQILGVENTSVATAVILPDGHARITGVSVGSTRLVGRDFAELPMIFPITVLARAP